MLWALRNLQCEASIYESKVPKCQDSASSQKVHQTCPKLYQESFTEVTLHQALPNGKTTTKRKLKYTALVKGFCSPEGILSAITSLHYQCLLTATTLQYFLRDKVLKSMAGFLPSNRTGNTEVNRNKFLIKKPETLVCII